MLLLSSPTLGCGGIDPWRGPTSEINSRFASLRTRVAALCQQTRRGCPLARHSIYPGDADIMQSMAASCLGENPIVSPTAPPPPLFFHVYLLPLFNPFEVVFSLYRYTRPLVNRPSSEFFVFREKENRVNNFQPWLEIIQRSCKFFPRKAKM